MRVCILSWYWINMETITMQMKLEVIFDINLNNKLFDIIIFFVEFINLYRAI